MNYIGSVIQAISLAIMAGIVYYKQTPITVGCLIFCLGMFIIGLFQNHK